MKQLGLKGKLWLKSLHAFLACLWIGTAVSMILLTFARGHISSGDELWAVSASIKLLDDYIIIPSAMGCLFTGILFSCFTNWGFFKFNWIIVKYVITISAILFGTFYLGTWVNGMEAIANAERLSALQNTTFLEYYKMNSYFGTLQAALLIFAAFISILKPWGKREKTNTVNKNTMSANTK